jgi:hypothetical protein
MKSVHTLVELERIDFTSVPTVELRAKLAQSLTQVAIMRYPRPFSNLAFEAFRDLFHLYCLVWLTETNEPRATAT